MTSDILQYIKTWMIEEILNQNYYNSHNSLDTHFCTKSKTASKDHVSLIKKPELLISYDVLWENHVLIIVHYTVCYWFEESLNSIAITTFENILYTKLK